MNKKFFLLIIAVMLIVLIFSGCTEFINQRKNLEKCKFEIDSAKLGKLSLNGIDLKLKINITNPNNTKVIVDRFDYEVFANEKYLGTGSNKEKFNIAANGSYVFNTTLFLGFNNLGSFIKELINKDEVEYKVKGMFYIDTPLGTIKYPVEITKIEK
ncbi:MAG: LEA type 2 family protein [bacterium]|nr:LEA type 2 family protein [bacterium]